MSNMRNVRTYVVSDYRSADDVANAAVGSGSKVLGYPSIEGRGKVQLVGVAVLHSLKVQADTSEGRGNPMIQAMNQEDRKLNQ